MFEGELTAGPIPTLFAEGTEESRLAICNNASLAHKDVQRMAKMFLSPEYVEGEEALQLTKKPRAGGAEFPFRRDAWKAVQQDPSGSKQDRPAKRQRLEDHALDDSVTGKIYL